MVRVYAKARNNDPTVPYNSRGLSFKSGRGFAVDVRVRDYNGSAAARYAEGVIVGFYESEAEACRVANEINNGTRYPPGHHFHTRAHGAIVVPAWNGPDDRTLCPGRPQRGVLRWSRLIEAQVFRFQDGSLGFSSGWGHILNRLTWMGRQRLQPRVQEATARPCVSSLKSL